MTHLEIHDQPRLGFRRTLGITWTGIRYRLFRAFMTLLVVTVAIAFLANMVASSLLRSTVVERARADTRELRLASTWISRLTFPVSTGELVEEIAQRLGSGREDGPFVSELREFERIGTGGTVTEEPTGWLRERTLRAHGYLQWFAALNYPDRRRLVQGREGLAVLDYLQDVAVREAFWAELPKIRGLRRPGQREDFDALLAEWPRLKARLEAIAAGRAAAVAQVNAYLGERTVLEALAPLDGGLIEVMRESGFRITQERTGVVAGQARDILLSNMVEKALQDADLKQATARRLEVAGGIVTPAQLWAGLRQQDTAEWYAGELQKRLGPAAGSAAAELDAPTLMRLAELRARLDALAAVLRDAPEAEGGWYGLGARLTYLLGISLLVCAVGITNAMLMSVTERYREIATLKCLGALDGSILSIFLLEACLLGAVGAAAGAVLGGLIGVLRSWWTYRELLLGCSPPLGCS